MKTKKFGNPLKKADTIPNGLKNIETDAYLGADLFKKDSNGKRLSDNVEAIETLVGKVNGTYDEVVKKKLSHMQQEKVPTEPIPILTFKRKKLPPRST